MFFFGDRIALQCMSSAFVPSHVPSFTVIMRPASHLPTSRPMRAKAIKHPHERQSKLCVCQAAGGAGRHQFQKTGAVAKRALTLGTRRFW